MVGQWRFSTRHRDYATDEHEPGTGGRVASVTPGTRRPSTGLSLVFGSSSNGIAMDIGLLAGRVVLAWVFIYYGAAKLFGWFPGPGPHGIHETTRYMADTAHLHPGELFAILAGLIEFGGGIAVGLGLLTRLAGLALFGDMVVAMITVTWATGLNSAASPPGYQLNIAVGVLALVVALTGAGRFSVDALIARRLGPGRVASSNGAFVGTGES
jgi:putative oxidoreductase